MASRIEPRTATRPRRLRVTPTPLPAVVWLRGVSAVVIRRVGAADTQALQQFFRDLSPDSRYRRFLRGVRELPEDMLTHLTRPDLLGEAVLVASLPHSPTRIIGMAQYADAGESSEIAVAVADAWQRQGLGYHLLDALLNVAAEAGIERIHADVLADNHAMRQLALKLGCEIAGNPAAPFLVRATKTLARKDPALSVGSWFSMFPPANSMCPRPQYRPETRNQTAARACMVLISSSLSPRGRGLGRGGEVGL